LSHKTEVSLELTDLNYIKLALTKLGFTYKEKEEGKTLKTVGRYGVHEDVDLVITGNGVTSYQDAIGLKKTEAGTFTATGDFFGLKDKDGKKLTEEALKREVVASSKEAELCARLNALGFTKANSSETKDFIELTLERWV